MKKNLLAVAVSSLAMATMAQAAFKDMTVDGIAVSKAAQEAVYNQAIQAGQQGGAQLEEAIRNRFVIDASLIAAARKSNVGQIPAVKEAIQVAVQEVTDGILTRAMLDEVATKYNPTKEELMAKYNEMKAQVPTEEYNYSVIATRTEAEAKSALVRLGKKEAFGKVAADISIDPTAKNNGELGWTFQQVLDTNLQAAVKNLKTGEYTKTPVKVNGQWVIVKLDAQRPTQFRTFEQYEPELQRILRTQKVEEYVQGLFKNAVIK